MFVDSHCHLNFQDFSGDMDTIFRNAADAGVQAFLTISCRMDEIPEIIRIAETNPAVFASVGIHPHEAGQTLASVPDASIYAALLPYVSHPDVIAIGETGLDYYYNHSSVSDQEKAFRQQIELGIEANLPVVVHTRDAEKDTIRILSEYMGQVKGVIHCFSGTQWLADEALSLGFYISFSGIVTFPKAFDLKETAKNIPLDRMLLETDAPFLAPVPKRGKRNEPAFMVHTAGCVAELRGIGTDVLANGTTDNFYRLFSKAQGKRA